MAVAVVVEGAWGGLCGLVTVVAVVGSVCVCVCMFGICSPDIVEWDMTWFAVSGYWIVYRYSSELHVDRTG